MNIPRPEYPRPQMVRESWINLNGLWEFEFDFGRSGKERGVMQKDKLDMQICVPFCPESELSGINYKDFINAVWYRRKFTIPENWKQNRTLLHFEAVDYYSEVWINGKFAGSHTGGYTPFSFDITDYLTDGENTIVVYAEDDTRTGLQPCGKQSRKYKSEGCNYTRVTGIWQAVWLENVPDTYIKSYKIISDIHNSRVNITVNFSGKYDEKLIEAVARYDGNIVGKATAKTSGSHVQFFIELSELHLWQPLDAYLYDLELRVTANNKTDVVTGYFGMRELELSENCVLINGKPVFQRLVLDQGYYKDGIYTAPSDEALKKDIELALALGFNGARLHEKVFERRFLYHADRMGYLVWGEYGNWGFDHTSPAALGIFLPQWMESVERDFNSPALIGWCPFNETWDLNGCKQDDNLLKNVYLVTKAMDPTRPVIDTSGNYHVITDIYDVHTYQQDIEKFVQAFKPMASGGEVFETFPNRQRYGGQPYFVSEYGGIWWNPGDENGWGYGKRPKDIDEFVNRYTVFAKTLLSNPRIFALCYTQLYDVEQEVNGLYYYDRTPKFPPEIMEKLRQVMSSKAAIEE